MNINFISSSHSGIFIEEETLHPPFSPGEDLPADLPSHLRLPGNRCSTSKGQSLAFSLLSLEQRGREGGSEMMVAAFQWLACSFTFKASRWHQWAI